MRRRGGNPESRYRAWFAVSMLAIAVAARTPAMAQTAASLACGLEAGPTRAVAAVLDGDTIRLDDGREVRLIGLIAPRAEDAGAQRGTWPPEEESRKALAERLIGRTVALAFQGPRSDRYGRVLAHLFLGEAGETSWVQAAHLEAGQARAFAPPGHDACLAHLLAREQRARAAARGLWANAAYQVRPADRPGELERYRGTFQLVAGRVAKTSGSRTLVILDLVNSEAERSGAAGRNRAGFRVLWNRSVKAMADAGTRAKGTELAGADILVRGWVETRRGPEIEIFGATQLEIGREQFRDPR